MFAGIFRTSRLAKEFAFIVRHARVARAQDATGCIDCVVTMDPVNALGIPARIVVTNNSPRVEAQQ